MTYHVCLPFVLACWQPILRNTGFIWSTIYNVSVHARIKFAGQCSKTEIRLPFPTLIIFNLFYTNIVISVGYVSVSYLDADTQVGEGPMSRLSLKQSHKNGWRGTHKSNTFRAVRLKTTELCSTEKQLSRCSDGIEGRKGASLPEHYIEAAVLNMAQEWRSKT